MEGGCIRRAMGSRVRGQINGASHNQLTNSLAIAEGPRDALTSLKCCQLRHRCAKNRIGKGLIVSFSRWSELFVENRKFFLTRVYKPPSLGMIPLEFHRDLWHRYIRVPGLSCGVIYVMICLAVMA